MKSLEWLGFGEREAGKTGRVTCAGQTDKGQSLHEQLGGLIV